MRISLLMGLMGLFCMALPAQPTTPERIRAGDFQFDPVLLSSEFPAYGQSGIMPQYRNAPQACELSDGSWIVAYSDNAFNLHVSRIHPQGAVKELFLVPQSYAYALAAQGDRFAMLSSAYKKKGYFYETEDLYFELFNTRGEKMKRVQLTGAEKALEKKTEYRTSFNAGMSPSGKGFQVFYNFFRDNGKYSGEYNRWLYVSPEGTVTERIENYNRDLRNLIGVADTLEWAVHLPTRSPRGVVLQVCNPSSYEDEYDIEEYELYLVADGQDKEQYMCHDNQMAFVLGDAITFKGKVYVSFAEALGQKHYVAGIIEVDPATGAKRAIKLSTAAGTQASPPRLGHCGGRMFVLLKELSAAKEAQVAARRKDDWQFSDPGRLDVVSIQSFNPAAAQPLGKAMPIALDWMNQPRNEDEISVYFNMRDRNMGDAIGVRAFQGHDSVLLFDESEGRLWAWRVREAKGS